MSAEYQAAIEAWAAVDAIAGKDQRGVRRVAQVGPAPDLILPEVAEPGAWVEGVIADGKKVVTSVKRPHRWVAVAPGSPVRHCERCRLKEMVVRRDGPEFCGGV